MATTLESWETMGQLQNARRRAIVVVVAVAAILVAAVFVGIRLWPDNGSPSGETAKGPDLAWQPAADGIRLPVSRSAGPKHLADGRSAGFARSEFGAALAAIHISHNASAGPGPAVFAATIRDQVTGNDRDAMLDRISREYEADRQKYGLPEGAPIPPSGTGRIAYKIGTYTDMAASVTVASTLAANATKFFAFDLEVRWINGDWLMVAPPSGSFASVFKELSELPPGFVIPEGQS